jgi:hypothetical protein
MVGVRIQPVSPDALVDDLAVRIVRSSQVGCGWRSTAPTRADPPTSRTHSWLRCDCADARSSECEALIICARRRSGTSAAVTDPDSFYDDWLDAEGLAREVLETGWTHRLRPDPGAAVGYGRRSGQPYRFRGSARGWRGHRQRAACYSAAGCRST